MTIHPHKTAQELGRAAAEHAAASIRRMATSQEFISIVFATGVSQLATLRALVEVPNIPWNRVIGFHMDEYIGISDQHPASFRRYLRKELTSRVSLREFHEMNGNTHDPTHFCEFYAELLANHSPQLCLLGIGENGHLAFNEPPADFTTEDPLIVVDLAEQTRRQQVRERWFGSLDQVPRQAVTMSIRQILKARVILCIATGFHKAQAVQQCFLSEIRPLAPASALRLHPAATVYLDSSASKNLVGSPDPNG